MSSPTDEPIIEADVVKETAPNLNQVLDKHLEETIRATNSKFSGSTGVEATAIFMENYSKSFCTPDKAVATKPFYHEGAHHVVPSMGENTEPVELVRISIPATPEITEAIANRLKDIPKGGDNSQLEMYGENFPPVRGAASGLCFGVVNAESPYMVNTASLKTESGKIVLMMKKSVLTALVDRAIGSKY